jgi:hypothetical protein
VIVSTGVILTGEGTSDAYRLRLYGAAVTSISSGPVTTTADSLRGTLGVPAQSAGAPAPKDRPPLPVDPPQTTGRRRLLRGLCASVAGVALAPALAASRSTGFEHLRFHETYRGRRIVGTRDDAGREGYGDPDTWHVTVDGRPLHLMRRVDGSWMTMVDHYQSYPTPLAAARAAVDELGPTARLSPSHPGGHRGDDGGTPGGGRKTEGDHHHGVHA